jgi:hypothetical protein
MNEYKVRCRGGRSHKVEAEEFRMTSDLTVFFSILDGAETVASFINPISVVKINKGDENE